MAYMIIGYPCESFDCSCGEEDQPLPTNRFWDMGDHTISCRKCGVVFDLSLEGDTDGGFYWEGTDGKS